jgi:DNA modification methylase
MNYDLFGNEIIEDVLLRDRFIEPPFSVLDTKSGSWMSRKAKWLNIGIQSEIGRNVKVNANLKPFKGNSERFADKQVSIFDPALTELMYRWYCPDGGYILDPFAGGSVRGIVASYLGYKYLGIDIRPEQIESNYQQAKNIFNDKAKYPDWICGDSDKVIESMEETGFDMIFSCPPYANLEVYSDLDGDISNLPYDEFLVLYRSIIKKSCKKLKTGGFAIFVVGEVRDSSGNYIGFVPDTIKSFMDCGMSYYNESILLNQLGNAAMRASNLFAKSKKLVKVHQNVLVFKKVGNK